VDCYRRSVQLRPDYAPAHYGLGTALKEAGKISEAIASYHRALELDPGFAEAHNNLGLCLEQQGQLDEAAICYRRATELAPDFVRAHWNLSLLLLLKGDYEHAWAEYEWRWKTGEIPARLFAQPKWDGQPLAGKTVLLYAEQGYGDTFHFVRYAPLVQRLGGRVILQCQQRLAAVLAELLGIDQLVPEGHDLPNFDFHAPLLSLPGIFNTTLATIPAEIPYIFADPDLVEHWRDRLSDIAGIRIGINWHGRVADPHAARRDIPLTHFLDLARLPGVRLISLQKSPPDVWQPSDYSHAIIDLGPDFDQARGPFVDTAAVMKNLDLVISSDTSIVHLAGALGVPVWVALPSVADWRWLRDRSDSPWYSTMRLFRQKKPGDWGQVFEEIGETLRKNKVFGVAQH
jgi:hypothetical protein